MFLYATITMANQGRRCGRAATMIHLPFGGAAISSERPSVNAPKRGSGANLKGSASGGNGLDDRTGLRTGTLQGSAFRPRDNCPVRAVVPDIQAQLP
jgi:hypothetical protein